MGREWFSTEDLRTDVIFKEKLKHAQVYKEVEGETPVATEEQMVSTRREEEAEHNEA